MSELELKIITAIRSTKILLCTDGYEGMCSTRGDEFVPCYNISTGIDAYLTEDTLQIGCMLGEVYSDGSISITIYKDGKLTVFHNPDGTIRGATANPISNFKINDTEEDLFMLSTVQNNFGISVDEINLFRQIWEYYFEPII